MKTLKKSFISLFIILTILLLCSCKNSNKIKVGILQYTTINALDNAKEGIIEGLKENGFIEGENIVISVLNPEADPTSLDIMAKDLVRKSDIVIGIATPAAVALQTAAKNEGKNIPIVFTAVTDPVDAKLVKDINAPEANITGTSDMNPVNEQIEIIKRIIPNIKKMGILYTVNETNSKVQADIAAAKAKELGIDVSFGQVTGINDITQITRNIIANGAEALYIPTDNNLAKNMPALVEVANSLNVITIVGEAGMCSNGGLITLGINYKELGKMTGDMAASILKGSKISSLAVKALSIEQCDFTINMTTAKALKIEIPKDILDVSKLIETGE